MRKYSWNMLFRDFRESYPDLWRRGTTYEPGGFMSLIIRIPGRGKLKYEFFGDKIIWLEHWEDPREVRLNEEANREKTYRYFIHAVNDVMDERGLTQNDVAVISGMSRKSINKYLNGRVIPKVSTMRKIGSALGINNI